VTNNCQNGHVSVCSKFPQYFPLFTALMLRWRLTVVCFLSTATGPGQLADSGRREHRDFGRRVAQLHPGLFDRQLPPPRLAYLTSSSSRAADSQRSFEQGLWQELGWNVSTSYVVLRIGLCESSFFLLLEFSVELLIKYSSIRRTRLIPEVALNYRVVQNKHLVPHSCLVHKLFEKSQK